MASLALPEKASSARFFYGRITRDEAEVILKERGCNEGLYLLRESISPLGNYAISICHHNKVHHYIIEKQVDGTFMIPEGRRFQGPIELIKFYQNNPDGFVTRPTAPCNRGSNQTPVAFRGMTYHDLEKELMQRAKSIKNVRMDKAMGTMRDSLIKMVAKDLHLKMPWYHQRISREEAEVRLLKDGHMDGKFLVRERDDHKSYALTLSSKVCPKHYFININAEKLSIEDGPKFECLIMLIDHYHNKQDGLACKLTRPVCCPKYDKDKFKSYIDNSTNNVLYQSLQNQRHSVGNSCMQSELDDPPDVPAPSPPYMHRRPSGSSRRPLPPVPAKLQGEWEQDTLDFGAARDIQISIDGDNLEDEYVKVRRESKRFQLNPSQIQLQDKLGSGQFGSVVKGVCLLGKKEIPVAIKTLKNEDYKPDQKPEIVREAEVMQELDHKHIVRMIGLCQAENIMLVLELAPLGPLNKYLVKNKDLKQSEVVLLMKQVAEGMTYLEARKFVHRDLAARNVLLVTERFAKISDFGMSKALNRDSNYYEASEAGKWPLKWYAPECIYYFKFDSRSDVWSYGVTLWEALSFGKKPYHKMKGQAILEFLQDGRRLEKPETCCDEAYEIMMECWKFEKTHRPSFSQLSLKMKGLYESLLAQRM
ncbi:tyrosine-protein kinase SYK-like [Haliotis rufescens]|uniref:tyrosine-protein kinase SYK-like n=1 Tax=Haliotis rufescens TaxID=6454 RepID=UPI001EAFB83F|nr:tyrosine-protein kinase SYK-like [Haliotis rufescens]